MEMKKEKRLMELRAIEDVVNGEEMIVEGYAITFNTPTVMYEFDGNKYYEVIAPNALDETDMKDVPFKYNHSDNVMIMARTRNKTLNLAKDEKGLYIRASIAPTTAGKDLYTLIKRGDIDKMSFAFTVEEDSYNTESRTRTILKIKKLYDVAAVDSPAYDTTSISARNFFEVEAEKEKVLVDTNKQLRNKLILKTYL
jgi:HK97 family phage prohead protease